MCLIAWRAAATAPWPLLLAANRDEFHAREAQAIHRWPALPASARLGHRLPVAERHPPSAPAFVIAGRDLVGGGTWLGLAVTARGLRIAMLTNLRNGRALPVPPDAPSRGLLVTDVLGADEPVQAAMERLGAHEDLPRMAGFNLVAIELTAMELTAMEELTVMARTGTEAPDLETSDTAAPGFTIVTSYLAHAGPGASSRAGPRRIAEGIHGLSNGELDAPWPKTRALTAAIARAGELRDATSTDPTGLAAADALLLDCLADRRPAPAGDLPDTGIDPARESWLSSPFIASEHYGTRCSTLVAVSADGRFDILERRYDRDGKVIGDARETISQARWRPQ